MRNLLYILALGAAMACALPSCKTSEENYRAAYEITKAKKTEGLTQEEIAGFAREEAIPKTLYRGDSIPLRAEYLVMKEGGADGKALRYNVIVASFKQIFNARSVYNRLREGGYSSAILLADRNSRYFIGATTTASLDSAVTLLRTFQADPSASPVPMRSPYPYILQNASAGR